MKIELVTDKRLLRRIRAPLRKAPLEVVPIADQDPPIGTGPTQVIFVNTAFVNGNLPEPEASLSDSKVSEVEAPEAAAQDKS
jgi:hypothetical protein